MDRPKYWSCFTCDYIGLSLYDEDADEECCPICGTHEGDGFGMIENDPRYRKDSSNDEEA